MKKKVIVAMSGGVDSSVSAALLLQAGHEVVGVTLKLLDKAEERFGCCGSPEDIAVAKRSAEKIGIPHYVLDYSRNFREDVINYFFHSYTLGQTPNPCVACNRHIKFDRLFHFIKALDGDCLATGHYARITQEPNGPYRLWRALDKSKDQSYVLYMLGQNHLSQTLFPLGDLPKSKTREIARALDLPNYAKPDSQDICFIPDGDYRGFLKNEAVKKGTSAGMERGPIRDSSGKVIGEHEGIAFYTIGQREGLGISAEKPLYVTRIDAPANTLVVGPAEETLAQKATVEDIKWVLGQPPRLPLKSLVQIRYKHQPVNATLRPRTPSGVSVDFESPLRAVTPGQSAVFYTKSDEVLGGGIIRS